MKYSVANNFLKSEFFRYSVVGLSTLILDQSLFLIIYRFNKSIIMTNILSTSLTLIYNYISHRVFTFKSTSNFLRTSLLYLIVLILNISIGTALVHFLFLSGFNIFLSKLISILILLPLTFNSSKFIFKF